MARKGRGRRSGRRSSGRRARRGRGRGKAHGFLPRGMRFGVVNTATLGAVVASAAGFAGSNILLDKIAFKKDGTRRLPASMTAGWGRVATKAGVGVVGATIAGKFLGRKWAGALATGALVSCALDVYNMLMPGAVGPGAQGYPDDGSIGELGDEDAQFSGTDDPSYQLGEGSGGDGELNGFESEQVATNIYG